MHTTRVEITSPDPDVIGAERTVVVLSGLAGARGPAGTTDYLELANLPTLGTASELDVDELSLTQGQVIGLIAALASKTTAADVSTAINALVGGAPGLLDTLDEIAQALGDDPAFAATITTVLAGKQPLSAQLTALAALTGTSYGRAFLELADAAAGRTALGLGSAATTSAGAYDVAGAAAAAQAAAVQRGNHTGTQLASTISDFAGAAVAATAGVYDASGLAATESARALAAEAAITAALSGKATPADISAAINALVTGAPGLLDTLDEIAAALGDDPNFAATMTGLLAGKQPLSAQLTAIALITGTTYGRAFLALADAAAGRTALGLGTAATTATGDYDVAGAAAAEAVRATAAEGLLAKQMVVDTFSASGTWTKRAGLTAIQFVAIGGGGGGGSGRRGAAGTVRRGGDSGAAGGAVHMFVPAALLSATHAVTVGTGGTAGAAVTADDTNGSPGGNGTFSRFGASASTFAGAAQAGDGGLGGTAAASAGAASGGASMFTGAAGVVSSATGLLGGSGISSGTAAASGAPGGGITTGNAVSGGGNGGNSSGAMAGGAPGTAPGGNGGDGLATTHRNARGGSGAGGGASSITGTGGNGGAALGYGAGGGGGGASLNGNASGAGGAGGGGIVIVLNFF